MTTLKDVNKKISYLMLGDPCGYVETASHIASLIVIRQYLIDQDIKDPVTPPAYHIDDDIAAHNKGLCDGKSYYYIHRMVLENVIGRLSVIPIKDRAFIAFSVYYGHKGSQDKDDAMSDGFEDAWSALNILTKMTEMETK